MSVIKNSRGQNRNDITIKRFVANQNIDDNGYKPVEYIGLNGSYLYNGDNLSKWRIDVNSTILMALELAADATGMIFGYSAGLRISMTASAVNWYNGSSLIHTISKPTGVHVFGFIKTSTGVKAFYDGKAVGTEATSVNAGPFVIGGEYNSSSSAASNASSSSSQTYAINVHDITGYLPYVNSGTTTRYIVHWYPTVNSNNPRMYETRCDLAVANSILSPHSGTSGAGSACTYGVQLHDIKTLTGSGYCDLDALIMEDGGVDTAAGWNGIGDASGQADTPSVVTKTSDSSTRNFAFYVGYSGNHIHIPDGYTAESTSRGYALGELIRGRKPKWDIWNDAVKFGFYVDQPIGGVLQMKFNALKIIDVSATSGQAHFSTIDGKAHLEWFDGYNSNSEKSHPAKLEVEDNELRCYIHNGAFSQCLGADTLLGDINGVTDDKCIFMLNETAGGKVTYRPGNLIPWNYTQSELGNYGYYFYGCKIQALQIGDDTEYFSSMQKEDVILCADTLASKGSIYRTGMIDAGFVVGQNKWHLLDILAAAEGNEITMRLKMTLMAQNSDPSSAQFVDCSKLLPTKEVTAKSYFDHYVNDNTTSDYRTIVDTSKVDDIQTYTEGGVTYNVKIGLVAPEPNMGRYLKTRFVETSASGSYGCIYVPFIRCYMDGSGNPVPIMEPNDSSASGYTKYLALVEVYTKEVGLEGTTYQHYICMIKSMNEIKSFYRYSYNGDPNADSPVGDWTSRANMFVGFWGGLPGTWTDANHLEKRHDYANEQSDWVWRKNSGIIYYRATTASYFSNSDECKSLRFITIPWKYLDETVGLPDEATALVHFLPTNTTELFSTLYEGQLQYDTHQKYIMESNFFPAGASSERSRAIWIVSTQMYYDNQYNATGYPIKILFRAYSWYDDGYVLWPNIRKTNKAGTSSHTFFIILYKENGDLDYTGLAGGTADPTKGRVAIATFEIDGSKAAGAVYQDTNEVYSCTLTTNEVLPDDLYFYPWAHETLNSAFQGISIKKNSGSLDAGCLYSIEIEGN